jgi:hypothetical protein
MLQKEKDKLLFNSYHALDLNETVKFKPFATYKGVQGAPLQVDVSK